MGRVHARAGRRGSHRAATALTCAAALLLISLAGCLGGDAPGPTPTPDPPTDPADVVPVTYRYACGAAASQDPCGRVITSPGSRTEPFLAADAQRPGVLAVGVNAGGPGASLDPTKAQATSIVVFTSSDGGDTWTETVPGTVGGGSQIDPNVAFDADGRLHVVGLESADAGPRTVFHAYSDDLGATWSDPVPVATDSALDRPYLRVHGDTLAVSWFQIGTAGHVAWSGLDGDWTGGRVELPGCVVPSRPLLHDGAWIVACTGGPDGADPRGAPDGVEVYRVAPGNATLLAKLTDLPGDDAHLTVVPGGIVLEARADGAIAFSRSSDGRTWSPAHRYTPESSGSVDEARPMWMEADDAGGVHLLVRTRSGCQNLQGLNVWTCQDVRVLHAILDPDDWSTVQEATLRGPEAAQKPLLGDDFYGIAFVDGEGVLAWSDGARVLHAGLVP